MPDTPETQPTVINISPNLGMTEVREVHQLLLSALETAKTGEGRTEIAFDGDPADVSPLALQLLASAASSFPEGALEIDAPGREALATLSTAEGS